VALHGVATTISINFPFGSLLRALVGDNVEVQRRLFAVAKCGARIDIRVNASAAMGIGLPLDIVHERLWRLARGIAPGSTSVTVEPQAAFRRFPSQWAKRLAYGRPSDVIVASAVMGI